jgi:hypothetical protein
MVQSADLGNFYYPANPQRLEHSAGWCIFVEREMSSKILVVVEVRFQDAPQTGFIQHDHMIQAFPTNRADQSLNVGVLPGRLR